jgi:dTDP-4-dehydrorhamnose reductase|tara:strand:+ start:619 stop:1329 length:711 start_codon:yes stop_codon:yes gene_type:complete
MSKKSKIVVTGGTGRFGTVLKNKFKDKFLFPNKKELDILNIEKMINYLKKTKPKYLIHLAGFSRPMIAHNKNISHSIKLNIIGTCNVVIACEKLNIKLIYFSTSYVYPGKKGNYKETDAVYPCNNYAWSKLGGETAVQMYTNSLILRVSMTEKPFVHKSAYANMITNFIFHEDIIPILKKVIHKKGIINIGGPSKTVYAFAKEYNPKIKKKFIGKRNTLMPKNSSMNLSKMRKLIK